MKSESVKKMYSAAVRSVFQIKTILIVLPLCLLLFFQNCTKVQFSNVPEELNAAANGQIDNDNNSNPPSDDGGGSGNDNPPPKLPDICNGTSCDLDPLTSKPAVTLILLALGDKANEQLVVNGASSQLIAETVVRYTTPVKDPKLLVVQDKNIHGEDPEDTEYLLNVLLQRYDVEYLKEPVEGLTEEHTAGFDLVWFNNPGYPMSSQKTLETLKKFKGGLILQGDDLAQGAGFSVESLTQVKFINNGTSVTCGDNKYSIDNNAGGQYVVSMNSKFFPQGSESNLSFKYGNDIDLVQLSSDKVEILASAKGDKDGCSEERPAIVRYFIEM